MIETALGIMRYGFAMLFGVMVSVSFAGVEETRKSRLSVACFCIFFLLVQSACWWLLGFEATSKLYPLIVHLPVILFLCLHFKRPWLISAVSMFSSYLCCQAPRWIGSIAGTIFKSHLAEYIGYIVAIFLAYYFLHKYVAGSVRQLIEKSKKSCIMFGAVPLFYYLFDYATAIYTDELYRGARGAVQFMPSVVSIFYFVFIILYYAETQKQSDAQRERDMLTAQLQLAKTEFTTLRQLQEYTAVYRHDMRHHFTFLQSLASAGSIDGIKEYLKTAQSDIDAITPVRFCENETANLILSDFSARAAHEGVLLSVEAKLPSTIPLSDTEFCSLLSNSLENAITAAAACPDSCRRIVTVKVMVYKNKLLISTENFYSGEIKMKHGLPQSPFENHGYGTRSIVAIANAHGGQAIFNIEGGIFNLKIMLPLHD